jgi:hypothetical protein
LEYKEDVMSKESIEVFLRRTVEDVEFRSQFLEVAKVVDSLELTEEELSKLWRIDEVIIKRFEDGKLDLRAFMALPSSGPAA